MKNNIIYNKVFTGEIAPLVINQNTVSEGNPTFPNLQTYDCIEVPLIKWRDIALKHLPINANLSTVETELKLEYLHFNYTIPSRVVVPESGIPVYNSRESVTQKQAKTIEFKSKYNREGNYAFEFRLIRNYDNNYRLDSTTPYTNQTTIDVTMDYPLGDYIYNNRISGIINCMDYLIPTGNITFADVKQELRLQILPRLSTGDVIICTGGYSGSVTFELIDPLPPSLRKSETITLLGLTPQQVLQENSNRYGFYLCNNSDNNIYYSFGVLSGSSAKLILKPGDVLVQEDKKLFLNNSEIDPGDTRYKLGLPLWVRGTLLGGTQQISIEEISFN